jgi:excisionase family DNA binding protein
MEKVKTVNMAIRYEPDQRKLDLEDLRCLSVAAVAERLGMSERQIARMIATGELPSVKAGRRRLVLRASIAAWLAGKAA